MIHPGYMLNPGDMFSVDQKKVLWATGAPKPGRIKAPVREGEEGEAASEEAPDPVTPDEAAAEAKKTAEVEAEAEVETEDKGAEEFSGKKGPEKKPWTKHNDPNNPIDVTKPYATPWRPRDYLPPFAFIPRYLEARITRLHFFSSAQGRIY